MTDNAITRAPISRGVPWPFLDALARVLGLFQRLLLLNARVEDHHLDPGTERLVRGFLDRHELTGVQVRMNEYDPMGDLARLWANRRVSLLLRATIGLSQWLATTASAGRIFGGDHYNPWSDTVHLYSSHPAIALHEVGHALDFRGRRWPGLYALTRLIPGLALYQEYEASRYAVNFLRERALHDEELRALRLLYPAYSTYVLGALVEFVPSAGRFLFLPVIALGHMVGISHALRREAELERSAPFAPKVADQWKEEWAAMRAEVNPATPRGRGFWGILVGSTVGSALCAVGTVPGAWLGYRLVQKER